MIKCILTLDGEFVVVDCFSEVVETFGRALDTFVTSEVVGSDVGVGMVRFDG